MKSYFTLSILTNDKNKKFSCTVIDKRSRNAMMCTMSQSYASAIVFRSKVPTSW